MSLRSAIYAGDVVHVRYRPRRHRLHYRVFALLLDLDELPALDRALRLFGHDRTAVFSFREDDHGDGEQGGLRAWVERQLAVAGIDLGRPSIRVLCYPRLFGYVFNPLTEFFCHDREGRLRAILHQVTNTFGERRTYIIPVAAGEGDAPVRQSARKELYVSPFVPMEVDYEFLVQPPADRVLVRVDDRDAEGLLLRASFSGRRLELGDRALFRLLLSHPLMTLKVIGGIHWEAFRLWLKGVPVVPHRPAARRVATSIVLPPSAPDHAPRESEAQPVREQA